MINMMYIAIMLAMCW